MGDKDPCCPEKKGGRLGALKVERSWEDVHRSHMGLSEQSGECPEGLSSALCDRRLLCLCRDSVLDAEVTAENWDDQGPRSHVRYRSGERGMAS